MEKRNKNGWKDTPEEIRVVIAGIEAAGKTALLYNLKLGEFVHTNPTIGYNLETIEYGPHKFSMRDLGGHPSIRRQWNFYLERTSGIVFVVSSTEPATLDDAAEALAGLLRSPDSVRVPLLVLVNKYDCLDNIPLANVTERLGIENIRDRAVNVCACSVVRRTGYQDGLVWLFKHAMNFDAYRKCRWSRLRLGLLE